MKRSLMLILLVFAVMATHKVYAYTVEPAEKDIAETDVEIIKAESEEIKTEIRTYYDVPLREEFQDFLKEECEMAGVDIELVLGIMKVESDFNAEAISETGDFGIMQINAINHKELETELGLTYLLDPHQGARGGIYLLNKLNYLETDAEKAMAYNMGLTGASRLWQQGVYETDYSRKVIEAKEQIGGTKHEVTVFCD